MSVVVNGPVSGSPASLVLGEPMRWIGQPYVQDSVGDLDLDLNLDLDLGSDAT
jgi:hypothetical protein